MSFADGFRKIDEDRIELQFERQLLPVVHHAVYAQVIEQVELQASEISRGGKPEQIGSVDVPFIGVYAHIEVVVIDVVARTQRRQLSAQGVCPVEDVTCFQQLCLAFRKQRHCEDKDS